MGRNRPPCRIGWEFLHAIAIRSEFGTQRHFSSWRSPWWDQCSGAPRRWPRAPRPLGLNHTQVQTATGSIVEGKVVNVSGAKVTPDNGTELMIPSSVKVQRADLKPGRRSRPTSRSGVARR
jgi:hypothetical protein